MTGLRTRRPTGQVAWPLILVEGQEKTGKSVAAYSLSADDRVGRTFVLDLGEGTADEYARLGRYEVIDHNGTYSDMWQQIEAACAEPRVDPAKPNVIEIDTGSAVWDLLKDWVNHRSRNSRAGRKKLQDDPDAEIDPSMNLWNDARDRWYRIVNQLRRSNCIAVVVCRARETALVKDGQPVSGQTDYKVECEKGTPFAMTAQVRMTKPHTATLVAVRSLDVQLPEKGLRLPDDNPLGHLVFDVLGCGADTVAANVTHATVGIPKPEAMQRLADFLTREGLDPKTCARQIWDADPMAQAHELAPDDVVRILDSAAAFVEAQRTSDAGPASEEERNDAMHAANAAYASEANDGRKAKQAYDEALREQAS